jgi:SET domain-containing protein
MIGSKPADEPAPQASPGTRDRPAVEARRAGEKGLGVFALRSIPAGELIERAPAIVLSSWETKLIGQTVLKKYYFEWGEEEGDSALVLGCGFLYNHSYQPNADYYRSYADREILFVATRDIEAGEEISINYNGFVDDMTEVEFPVLP